MSVALDLFAKLTETSDDRERARLIADAFEALEARFPHLNDLATQGHVRESELRLQKEIKEVEARLQKDIKAVELQIREVEARLQKDIKAVELQIREVEARLQQEIKAVELKIGQVEVRISEVEVNLHKAMAAQTRWLLGGLAVLGAVFKLADLLIVP
jgi:chromosome segregation ATPase